MRKFPSPAQLERRQIRVADEKHESYGRAVFSFLDRVEIAATGRTVWSRTDESVLVANQLDPRFRGAAELPNQWRPLRKSDDGAGAAV